MPTAAIAQFESLGRLLSLHRGVTRVSVAALSITVIFALSTRHATHAGPLPVAPARTSILPLNIGVGVASDSALAITFEAPMDPVSVEAALQLTPSQPMELRWSEDGTRLEISAARLWRTDQRYLVEIGPEARQADGSRLRVQPSYSFTTQTAPTVSAFMVRLAVAEPGADAAALPQRWVPEADVPSVPGLSPTASPSGVSAGTVIRIGFSSLMDAAEAKDRFTISPAVEGDLTWTGGYLVFRPTERLVSGMRYTVSVVGAHDVAGNAIGGKTNLSFTVAPAGHLISTSPPLWAVDVETGTIQMWFSQPMDAQAVDAALAVADATTGELLAGDTNWYGDGTHVVFAPSQTLPQGHVIEVRLADGSIDADGNPVTGTWSFTTKPPPPPPPEPAPAPIPVVPPPAPSATLEGYALNQINAARAAYGFAPLVIDPAISAVAYAHAYDQAINGYFSHVSLDGRTREDRLRAGGVSFSYSGENQCYLEGSSLAGTLDWCHAAFMAEPYPGHWNHIANILDPRFTRVGVGIAQAGARVIVTWNFAN